MMAKLTANASVAIELQNRKQQKKELMSSEMAEFSDTMNYNNTSSNSSNNEKPHKPRSG